MWMIFFLQLAILPIPNCLVSWIPWFGPWFREVAAGRPHPPAAAVTLRRPAVTVCRPPHYSPHRRAISLMSPEPELSSPAFRFKHKILLNKHDIQRAIQVIEFCESTLPLSCLIFHFKSQSLYWNAIPVDLSDTLGDALSIPPPAGPSQLRNAKGN